MHVWKKSAFLGLIWGLMPFIMGRFEIPLWLGRILAYPAFLATQLGFAFRWIYLGSPLVGVAMGILVGLAVEWFYKVYEKRGD